jgi:hypothetical protein
MGVFIGRSDKRNPPKASIMNKPLTIEFSVDSRHYRAIIFEEYYKMQERQLALFQHQKGLSSIGVNPYHWCDCATSQELARRLCQQLNGMNLSKELKSSKAIALEAIVKDGLPANAHWSVVLRVKKALKIA